MQNKNIRKWHKSIFSLLIAMAMIFSMLPVSAFAQDTQDTTTLGTSDAATSGTTNGGDLILTDGENDPDALLECDCESKCTEDEINADCPVCAEHPEWCVVGVESPEIAAMSGTARTTILRFDLNATIMYAGGAGFGNPTTSNLLDSTEGWKWYLTGADGYDAKTLVLDGLDLSVSGSIALYVPAGTTIKVIGNSSITTVPPTVQPAQDSSVYTIRSSGALTIDVDSGVTLAVSTGDHPNPGTFSVYGVQGTLTKKGSGTLAVTAGNGSTSCGTSGSTTVSGGTIEATGNTRAIGSNYTVPAGYLYYVNTSPAPDATELTGNGSTTVIGSTHKYAKITAVSIDYTLFLDDTNGTLHINDATGADVTNDFAGTADISGSAGARILTLGGFNFSTSAAKALQVPDGTTINVTENSSITSTFASLGNQSNGINSAGALTIDVAEDKALTVTSGNPSTSFGIYTVNSFTKDGKGDIYATSGGDGSPLCSSTGIVVMGGSFVMNDGTIYSDTTQVNSGNAYAMSVYDNNVPDNIVVTGKDSGGNYTVEAQFSSSGMNKGRTVTKATPTTAVKDAKITADSSINYTLYYNSDDGLMYKESTFDTEVDGVDGWSGNGSTLTLNGIDFTTSANIALQVPDGTTITLASGSDNKLETTATGTAIAIYWTGPAGLKINGTGSLNAISMNATGGGSAFVGSSLTIEDSLNITTATGGDFGIDINNNFTVNGGTLTCEGFGYGFKIHENFAMTGGTIYAKGGVIAATVVGSVPENVVVKGKAADNSYSVVGMFSSSGPAGSATTTMAGIPNFIADAMITLESPYDYTLEFTGNGGVLQKKGDSATQPFDKDVDYTVNGMTLTLNDGFEFVTSANVALQVPAGTIIKADGDSRLESTFSANNNGSRGIDAFGALTIDVAAGKTLTVISGSGTMNAGINTANSLTKSGTGTLKATGGMGMGNYPYSQGICVNAGSFTMNGGIVYADIPVSATGDAMYVQGNNVPDNIIVMGESLPGSGTYNAEAQFTSGWIYLKSNPTTAIKAAKITLPGPGYSISGTITDKDGNAPTGTVAVKLYHGTTQIDSTITLSSAPYDYSFSGVANGVYYIVAESSNSKATASAVVNGANVIKDIALLPGNMESAIEIKSPDTPPTAVDGLNNLFDADDDAVVAAGGSVAITLEVEKKTAPVDAGVIQSAATGQTVGLFLDLSVLKTQTASDGTVINSDYLTNLGSNLITITSELPANLQNKSNLRIFRSHNGVAEELTATPNADGETAVISSNIVTLTVCKFSTYAITYPSPPTPTPSGDSSGGSSKQDNYTPAPNPWLEPTPAKTLATDAGKGQKDSIRTKSTDTYGVRKASWQNLKGYRYYHDTMEGNAVQVRLYIDNPAAMTRDMYVTGFVNGSIVDSRKAFFEKWFSNKIRIIHMDEAEPWGQEVHIAAKVDLANMDTKNLYFYSYDKKANKYTRITAPKYWIDKNDYLHFYTELAGDIIVSNGSLEKK